jgi:hypothetical protein
MDYTKKNIIVVGDSYASSKNGYPQELANLLNLNLICFGEPSAHWWTVKLFLDSLSDEVKNNTEVIVFCHTYTHRVPSDDTELNRANIDNADRLEHASITKDSAVNLYFKFVHNMGYSEYVEQCWFKDITETWSHIKLINLHCFPWSLKNKNFLGGVSVTPSLTAISLNEIGAQTYDLRNDSRPNHLSHNSNIILAQQLAEIINNYTVGDAQLDVTKFEQLTTRWFEWDISHYKTIY